MLAKDREIRWVWYSPSREEHKSLLSSCVCFVISLKWEFKGGKFGVMKKGIINLLKCSTVLPRKLYCFLWVWNITTDFTCTIGAADFLAQCLSAAGSTVSFSPSNVNWTYLIQTSVIRLLSRIFFIVPMSSTIFINSSDSGTGLKSDCLCVKYCNVNSNFGRWIICLSMCFALGKEQEIIFFFFFGRIKES